MVTIKADNRGPRMGAMYSIRRTLDRATAIGLHSRRKQTDIFPILYVLLHDVYDLANLYIAACLAMYRGTSRYGQYRFTFAVQMQQNIPRLHSNAFYCERYASAQGGVVSELFGGQIGVSGPINQIFPL